MCTRTKNCHIYFAGSNAYTCYASRVSKWRNILFIETVVCFMTYRGWSIGPNPLGGLKFGVPPLLGLKCLGLSPRHPPIPG